MLLDSSMDVSADFDAATLSGSDGQPADSALTSLLAYDPSGVQNLKQNSAALTPQVITRRSWIRLSQKSRTKPSSGKGF